MKQPRHLVSQREVVFFKARDYTLISEGDYSDYQVVALLKMKMELADIAVETEWRKRTIPKLQTAHAFAAFLVQEGYAEDITFREINVSDEREWG